MGMNKLYLNENILRNLYNVYGIDYIKDYLNESETIICNDEFSSNVSESIKNQESIIKYFNQ
jgi:hypothetical protein